MTHLTLSAVSADDVRSSSEFMGKVALVTGGALGIGAAIAPCLCAAGATTLLVDRDLAAASRTAAEISASGGKALPIAADVSDPDSTAHAVEACRSLGGELHFAVN